LSIKIRSLSPQGGLLLLGSTKCKFDLAPFNFILEITRDIVNACKNLSFRLYMLVL